MLLLGFMMCMKLHMPPRLQVSSSNCGRMSLRRMPCQKRTSGRAAGGEIEGRRRLEVFFRFFENKTARTWRQRASLKSVTGLNSGVSRMEAKKRPWRA